MRHVFATNMGLTFSGSRDHWWLALLQAPDGTEFITGDQPAVNTYAAGDSASDTAPERLEFYYPVTPKIAVLIGDKRDRGRPTAGVLTAAEVERLNRHIIAAGDEQLYASCEMALREL